MKRGVSSNKNLTSSASCFKQNGISFALRYYSQTTHQPEKRLTQPEAEALSAAGITIGVVYEDGPTALGYFSNTRGHLDAVNACGFAVSLHQPPGSAIYFAVDYDATLSDIAGAIFDYFQGIDRGMRDAGAGIKKYSIGVYGSGAVCDFIKKHCAFVRYSWLAESTGWLGSRTYTNWDVKQASASASLCGLPSNAYEENQAHDDFGGFALSHAAPLTSDESSSDQTPTASDGTSEHAFLLSGLSIDDMHLTPATRASAELLKRQVPDVVFTSGRRTVEKQASAMAQNVVSSRNWIKSTYKPSPERDALQGWVDSHPSAVTADAIASGLRSIMAAWTDDQRSRLSKHFSGQAFDVHPVAGSAGNAIKSAIHSLPNLVKFLDTEGGLIIWHAEFSA